MIHLPQFVILISFIVIQRLVELMIANHNEKWMKQQGAIEFGKKHYKYMVIMHLLFFVALFTEKFVLNRGLSPLWPFILTVFSVAQFIRCWAIYSLGKYWNTKILVLADALVVKKGPYRFLRHPNYIIVAIELLVVPMLFNAFYTAFLFTILNVIMLLIRIPEEEKALSTLTEYDAAFQNCYRFIPKIVK